MVDVESAGMWGDFGEDMSVGASSFSTSFGRVAGLDVDDIQFGDSEKDVSVIAEGLDEDGTGETSEVLR